MEGSSLGRAVAGEQEKEELMERVRAERPGEDAERRLILVGKSGGGKSATGNTLLSRREFESILGAKTTLRCQRGQGSWQGRRVSVVDTPAIFDSDDFNKMVRHEIMACIELSRPGPHALIFVTQVGRFTVEDAAAAKRVQDIFGPESTSRTIILFTCKEDLGGDPLQEYVRGSDNAALRALIRQCGHRVCGFNNKAAGAEREGQVSELMGMVEEIISESGGRYYVNQLYLEPDLQDAKVRSFLAKNKSIGHRAALGPWSSKRSWICFIGSLGFVVIVIVIIVVHFS